MQETTRGGVPRPADMDRSLAQGMCAILFALPTYWQMNGPLAMRYPILMAGSTTKNKKNNKKSRKGTPSRSRRNRGVKALTRQVEAYTPFADVGGSVGGALFGPIGRSVGKWLGSGVGTIFGSGSYALPEYNVLMNQNQIPKFSTSGNAHVVSHREFIGDVTGTTGFSVTNYAINPGNPVLFPWLSQMAAGYEQYRIHGLIFEFRSTSSDYNTSNPSLGAVVLATQYDTLDPAFTSKQQMENYEFAVSGKPSLSIIHGVECDPRQEVIAERYVSPPILGWNAPAGADARFYNLGNLAVATAGMSSSYVVGELWCSYVVELIKPKISGTIGLTTYSQHLYSTGCTAAQPVGTPSFASGNMSGSGVGSNFGFYGVTGLQALITLNWYGGATASLNAPPVTLSGCTLVPYYLNDTASSIQAGNAGTTVALTLTFVVRCTGNGAVNITLGSGGTVLPSSATLDIFISSLDSSVAK